MLFPEYPTWRDRSNDMAADAIGWLTDESKRQAIIARLQELRQRVATGGASAAAAEYIVKHLKPDAVQLSREIAA
jgi:lipid-A-disaccharide synthase